MKFKQNQSDLTSITSANCHRYPIHSNRDIIYKSRERQLHRHTEIYKQFCIILCNVKIVCNCTIQIQCIVIKFGGATVSQTVTIKIKKFNFAFAVELVQDKRDHVRTNDHKKRKDTSSTSFSNFTHALIIELQRRLHFIFSTEKKKPN